MRASDETIRVFASPGTPTSRQCPRAMTAASICSITDFWPTIACPNSCVMVLLEAAKRSSSVAKVSLAMMGTKNTE